MADGNANSIDLNDHSDDLTAAELINDRPLKRAVAVGFAFLAISMFLPGTSETAGISLSDLAAAIGAWCIVVPLLMVAWHQNRTKKRFGAVAHLVLPVIGTLMVAARVVLVPAGASTIFLNLWSIGGTFLIVPLVQQLVELVCGSVDMETGGRQVRYQ